MEIDEQEFKRYLGDKKEINKLRDSSEKEPTTLKEMIEVSLENAKNTDVGRQIVDCYQIIYKDYASLEKIDEELKNRNLECPKDGFSEKELEEIKELKELRRENFNKMGEQVLDTSATVIGMGIYGAVNLAKNVNTIAKDFIKSAGIEYRKERRKIRGIKRNIREKYRSSKFREKLRKLKRSLYQTKKGRAEKKFKKRENKSLNEVVENETKFSRYLLEKVKNIITFGKDKESNEKDFLEELIESDENIVNNIENEAEEGYEYE